GSGGLWLGLAVPKPHARLQSGLYSIAPNSDLLDGGLAHKIPNRGQDLCSPLRLQRQDMSNAPPQAHPNWMLTATPKGWHYNPHPIWMRLSLVKGVL
ncbi:MAG: hypothetical protein P8H62_04105, partial [Henriciella sp.]|nr:hypothetical protein [Henriciella sp.]